MTDRIMLRPILFSAPMVRALLAGTKTQTRRIMKPQPGDNNRITRSGRTINVRDPKVIELCRHGQAGDRLWVRETWAHVPITAYRCSEGVQQTANPKDPDMAVVYAAGWDRSRPGRWRPSIHMPRWASRITLEITGVRVERLQEISEDDAKAEGATARPIRKPWGNEPGWAMDWSRVGEADKFGSGGDHNGHNTLTESDICLSSARWAFSNFIDKINGPGAWSANPWVWMVEFKRVMP